MARARCKKVRQSTARVARAHARVSRMACVSPRSAYRAAPRRTAPDCARRHRTALGGQIASHRTVLHRAARRAGPRPHRTAPHRISPCLFLRVAGTRVKHTMRVPNSCCPRAAGSTSLACALQGQPRAVAMDPAAALCDRPSDDEERPPQPSSLFSPRPRPQRRFFLASIVAHLLWQVFVASPVRDMDFVELFAGEAAVSNGMRMLGFHGWTLDLRISLDHDLLSPAGFVTVLACIARLRPGAVFWAAPPCSTWVFMSRHSTGRDRDLSGNPASPYVQAQNALVCRLLVVLRFCMARGVYWIVEQPHSTVMFEYPPFKRWLAKLESRAQDAESSSAGRVQRVSTQMGAFGMRSVKETILLGTAPYLDALVRRMTSRERKALQHDGRMLTAISWTDAAGRKRCQGGKDLKATQSYPVRFGLRHALAFQASDRNRALGKALAAVAAENSRTAESPDAAAAAAADSIIVAEATADPQWGSRGFESDSDEDDWYLKDVANWGAMEWHNNFRREQLLKLQRGGA